jgi:hypothetical protein
MATRFVPGAGARLVIDTAATDELQMQEPALTAYLDEELRMLLTYAQSFTPVNTGAWHLADTLNMIRSLPDPSRKTQSGAVYSTSSIWNLIEWGSIKNEPYRPLSSAAVALGLPFHEVDQQI